MTPKITFEYHPAEDESVDDETVVLLDGEESGYSIQHTDYAGPDARRSLNQYFYDAAGNLTGMRHVSDHASDALAAAAVTAILAGVPA
ncbi:hypothetical protein [Shinella zoogloeoides]|uniref:hypothetical protein n=1 Tax=Shinella zoogloeoides TaxID=352475 RepID=UPI00273F5788|nr:hypothetical protein [Shinella zoogloeoides]WLR90956.1 hypothetical protein Q9316_00840 [Shinella zoogloeoides]